MDSVSGVALLMLLLPIGIVSWSAWERSQKLRRMRLAESEPLPCDVCLACGEREVEEIAPQVVRCLACGFVGGQGMAAWQRKRREEELVALAPEARTALAREKLREAQDTLDTAEQLLNQAWSASWTDLLGFSFDRGVEKQNALMGGLAQMSVAELMLDEGAWLLDSFRAHPVFNDAPNPWLMALDTGWFTDSWWIDWAVHRRIKRARAQLRGVREQAEALKARVVG